MGELLEGANYWRKYGTKEHYYKFYMAPEVRILDLPLTLADLGLTESENGLYLLSGCSQAKGAYTHKNDL